MPEILIGDDVFNVEIDGPEDAPALLLSNSLGTSLRMWDRQIPAWSKTFRVIRYDSRGHGASAAPDRPYSIGELAGDALAILDALDVDTAHFVGLSKGGMVGQWLLTHHPDRIGRAVLANTAPHMGPPQMWNDRIAAVREGGMETLIDSVLARWFTPQFRDSDPESIEAVAQMLRDTPAHGYAACCAAIRDMDQREPIRSIAGEVMVIVGENDPATTPAAGQAIVDSIAGASLTVLPAAHLSNIEAAEAFTDAVLRFLTRRPAKKTAAPAPAARKRAGAGRKAAKKAAPKKAASRTSASKKSTAKKSTAKKSAAKKSAAKKSAAKKSAAKKSAAKKSAARKPAAKKPAARKSAAKKPAAKAGSGSTRPGAAARRGRTGR
ncbi:MAG: 3-oxoadipate enol-lactonase [Methylobacteriaceae bacterium]|nr:3-oxoadipate enol-lactonase [Methylobacteriaceae bacterium]